MYELDRKAVREIEERCSRSCASRISRLGKATAREHLVEQAVLPQSVRMGQAACPRSKATSSSRGLSWDVGVSTAVELEPCIPAPGERPYVARSPSTRRHHWNFDHRSGPRSPDGYSRGSTHTEPVHLRRRTGCVAVPERGMQSPASPTWGDPTWGVPFRRPRRSDYQREERRAQDEIQKSWRQFCLPFRGPFHSFAPFPPETDGVPPR